MEDRAFIVNGMGEGREDWTALAVIDGHGGTLSPFFLAQPTR